MTPAAGDQLGPYEIRSLLGAGGMGRVYRARDKRLNRDVAVKLLPATFVGDDLRRRRFVQEAQTASALNHPNIVSIYDVNLESDPPYIVSELVEGVTLYTASAGRAMSLGELLGIAVQIADGLAAAHEAGVVHRDLKPANILLTRDGRVKIADFGLAKQLRLPSIAQDQDTVPISLLSDGVVMGTAEYMSPEQARGEAVDTRSDIFSFGVILYEMACGKRPFDRPSKPETLTAILKDDPPRFETQVPLPLWWIVRRCLAKSPAQRYQSTRDLYHDLRQQSEFLETTGTASGEALAPPRAGSPRRATAPAIVLTFVLGALAGLAGAAWLLRAPSAGIQSLQFHPLATGAEDENSAAWSPDGRGIAYQAMVDRTYQIFTKRLDSDTPEQLTRCPEDCTDPAWSPDGSRLYYLMRRAVWEVGAAGGEPRMVMDGVYAAFAISPDGNTLAFMSRDTGSTPAGGPYLSSPPGAAPVRYTPSAFVSADFNGARLAFSPDGKRLLFWVTMVGLGRPSEFWLLPLPPSPSSQPRSVLASLKDPSPVVGMSWLPDNRRIVVAFAGRPEVDRTHLYVADLARDTARPLLSSIGMEQYPAVSPDGTRVAYTAVDLNTDVVEAPLDGSPVRRLLASNRMESAPSWSPRERQMAYVTDRRGVHEIWLTTLERGWEKPLIAPRNFPDGAAAVIDSPAFSPDGERIAFSRGARIWIASVSGGSPIRLTGGDSYQLAPTWSPDGNWIAFYSRAEQAGIFRARLGGKEPPVLVRAIPGAYRYLAPVWSPRGDWIAYSTAGETTITSPDGPAARVVRKGPLISIGWSRDGATLYGVTPLPRQSLVAIELATGRETVISQVDPRVVVGSYRAHGLTLSLSPDGKSLATTAIRQSGDIWMLENWDPPRGLLARLGWLSR